MEINQLGRSMVEMIGVLAVIGVLSVGAIAGYSNAMLKYKLNKQTSQYNQILAACYKYDEQWGNLSAVNMISLFKSLNEIPKEMITSNSDYIYDVFHNRISISYASNYKAPLIFIRLSLNESDMSMQMCRNAFFAAKEWHENIFVMESYGTSSSSNKNMQVYGDKRCVRGEKCLIHLTLDDIDDLCRSQLGRNLDLKIYTADHRDIS